VVVRKLVGWFSMCMDCMDCVDVFCVYMCVCVCVCVRLWLQVVINTCTTHEMDLQVNL